MLGRFNKRWRLIIDHSAIIMLFNAILTGLLHLHRNKLLQQSSSFNSSIEIRQKRKPVIKKASSEILLKIPQIFGIISAPNREISGIHLLGAIDC
ncbi:hypothetical protein N7454_010902 [Penicillium verhagenii]|nr:hypothetical protein N7454_010902 [Penicillium verhagenii]